jgi:hypothetical protein
MENAGLDTLVEALDCLGLARRLRSTTNNEPMEFARIRQITARQTVEFIYRRDQQYRLGMKDVERSLRMSDR